MVFRALVLVSALALNSVSGSLQPAQIASLQRLHHHHKDHHVDNESNSTDANNEVPVNNSPTMDFNITNVDFEDFEFNVTDSSSGFNITESSSLFNVTSAGGFEDFEFNVTDFSTGLNITESSSLFNSTAGPSDLSDEYDFDVEDDSDIISFNEPVHYTHHALHKPESHAAIKPFFSVNGSTSDFEGFEFNVTDSSSGFNITESSSLFNVTSAGGFEDFEFNVTDFSTGLNITESSSLFNVTDEPELEFSDEDFFNEDEPVVVELPSVETEAPETEASVTKEPVTEAPETEASVTKKAVTEAPIESEAPATDAPTEEPNFISNMAYNKHNSQVDNNSSLYGMEYISGAVGALVGVVALIVAVASLRHYVLNRENSQSRHSIMSFSTRTSAEDLEAGVEDSVASSEDALVTGIPEEEQVEEGAFVNETVTV
jgi:hypothetical protein